MPKIAIPSLPISGVFGIVKPSGPTSMSVVEAIQARLATSKMFVAGEKLETARTKKLKGRKVRELLKVGQGGTLDPLADGVLVVGVGKGTKQLSRFLDCTKEYRATCLLGSETDTYDSQGSIVDRAPWKHVTRDLVENKLAQFRGDIQQIPPVFSALKMDGKPLYEYAREGIPLPRAIDSRKVTIHDIEVTEWLGTDHDFSPPSKELTVDERIALAKAIHKPESELLQRPPASSLTDRPSAFVLRMTVSSGTYVRTILHDLAHLVGSAGHVVTLTRSRQGEFALEPKTDEERACLPWNLFTSTEEDERDGDGWTSVERKVLDSMIPC